MDGYFLVPEQRGIYGDLVKKGERLVRVHVVGLESALLALGEEEVKSLRILLVRAFGL